MNTPFRRILIYPILMIFSILFTSCTSNAIQNEPAFSDTGIVNNKPTVPLNVPEGIAYLYDFRFSDRYDDNIINDFSLVLSKETNQNADALFLFAKYQNEPTAENVYTYSGDGMVPYTYKRYWYPSEKGALMVGTDDYEADHVEYISYLWSNKDDVKTNKDISVGSTENQLLSAYTDYLYYLTKDEALSERDLTASRMIGNDFGSSGERADAYDFDYAYMWQPYTPEKNDIRDITFYMKNGTVAAIEMINPFELRHAYGYDRDAGLQYTERKRTG